MKKRELKRIEVRKVKALSEKELMKLLGGSESPSNKDSIDVSSELASGGTTTDTWE